MRKSIYLLTTTPTSHTHRFHPLQLATPASCLQHPLATPIHSTHSPQVKSMDDNCGEWVKCMGVASGCCEQEAGGASWSGWNLWVWLVGVVVRRYNYRFLILLILLLYLGFFAAASLLFVHFFKCFSFLFQFSFVIKFMY